MTNRTTTIRKVNDPKADAKRAAKLMATYAELYAEKQDLDKKAKEKAATVVASLEEAKIELLAIGKRNKKQFGKDGNWNFDEGYLHRGFTSEITTGKKFRLPEFVKNFPDYINTTFRVAELKKALMGAETRTPFMEAGVDVKTNEKLEIIVRK